MKTQCPHCKAKFNASDNFAGKQAKCPKCTKPFTIEPFIEPSAAAQAPAKSQDPVTPPPVKTTIQTAAPVKTAEPVKSTAKIAEPIKAPPTEEKPIKQEIPESIPASKGISKIVFVYCWMVVRIVAGILAGLGLMSAINKGEHSTLIAVFAGADIFLIISVLIELLLFYKMWAAISDSQASMTPAKAVGFLFIPVFSIYWALCMVTGFVEDYNSFIHRRMIKVKDLPFVLFLIYAFTFISVSLVVTIPMLFVFAFLGLINRAFNGYPESAWALCIFAAAVGVIHFILYALFATKTCSAINALSGK
jgi:predicted Zn finger-like uncharacterized protein